MRFKWLAFWLAAALLSLGCGTWTVATTVLHDGEAQDRIGMHMNVELDKAVFDALEESEPGTLDSLIKQWTSDGWDVTSSASGRIVDADRPPTVTEALGAAGWTVTQEQAGSGRILHASLDTVKMLKYDPKEEAGIKSIRVTIDESDPANPRFTYDATVIVRAPEQASGSSPSSPSSTTATAPDGQPIEINLGDDPKVAKLNEAIKNAPPPQVILTAQLPGTLDPPTVNGSAGGEIVGNEVRWTLVGDKVGTFVLQATSTGTGTNTSSGTTSNPGGSENTGDVFTVGGGCATLPGEIICAATTGSAKPDAILEYQWSLDGKVLRDQTGKQLDLTEVPAGSHIVTVVARDTTNNLVTGPVSFDVNVEQGSASAPSNSSAGNFVVTVSCAHNNVLNGISCSAIPVNAPPDADIDYVWSVNGNAVGSTTPNALIEDTGDGVYVVTVSAQDAVSGKTTPPTSTTVLVGSPVDTAVNVWLTGETKPDPIDVTKAAEASVAVAIALGGLAVVTNLTNNGIFMRVGGDNVAAGAKMMNAPAPAMPKPTSLPEAAGTHKTPKPVTVDPPPRVSPTQGSAGDFANEADMGMYKTVIAEPTDAARALDDAAFKTIVGAPAAVTAAHKIADADVARGESAQAADAAQNQAAGGVQEQAASGAAAVDDAEMFKTVQVPSAGQGHADAATAGASAPDEGHTGAVAAGTAVHGDADAATVGGSATGQEHAVGAVANAGAQPDQAHTVAMKVDAGTPPEQAHTVAMKVEAGTPSEQAHTVVMKTDVGTPSEQAHAMAADTELGQGAQNVASAGASSQGGDMPADALGELVELRVAVSEAEKRHKAANEVWNAFAAAHPDADERSNSHEWGKLQEAAEELSEARKELRNFVLLHPTLFTGA